MLERGEPGRAYHINGDTELTNVELTEALLDCCGAGLDMVVNVTDRKGHDRRYSLDDSLLRAWATPRGSRSARACGRPWTGTGTTAGGGSR